MPKLPRLAAALAAAAAAAFPPGALANGIELRVAVATTVVDSGLMAKLQDAFQENCKCLIKAIAAGSSQGLELVRRGDVDAAVTHVPDLEEAFLESGHGSSRTEFMANDFILVGPSQDPAHAAGQPLAAAFAAVASTQARFVSRQDGSGTHRAEEKLWDLSGLASASFGDWYVRAGAGMGNALLMADELAAYTLSDSATFAYYATDRKLRLSKLAHADPQQGNRYSLVVSARAESNRASEFRDWLTSPSAAEAITAHESGGKQLFVPLQP